MRDKHLVPPLCFLTDPSAPLPIPEQAERAARGGARWIQLRHKSLAGQALTELALAIRERICRLGAMLIINDHVGVACAIDADGVHIGQSDGDARQIRRRIRPDAVLGLSIETADQLAAVPEDCVTYLGVGPVRATPTKSDHASPIGFAGLARIVGMANHPCMAIGGLGVEDIPRIKAAGCAGLAVVSAIAQAGDPETAARTMLAAWETT